MSLYSKHRNATVANRTTAGQRMTSMKLVNSFASWRKYRETCVELNRLSERELSDIGMTRSEIPFAARRAL